MGRLPNYLGRVAAALVLGGILLVSGVSLGYPGVALVVSWIKSPPTLSAGTLLSAPAVAFLLFMSLGGGALCIALGVYGIWRVLRGGFETGDPNAGSPAAVRVVIGSPGPIRSTRNPEPKGFVDDMDGDGGGED